MQTRMPIDEHLIDMLQLVPFVHCRLAYKQSFVT